MKQQILNLKKKLLLVELPEGAMDIEISVIGDIIFKTIGTKEVIWLPKDRVVKTYIGKLTDITESQFTEFVEKTNVDGFCSPLIYKDYIHPKVNALSTAKESFFSYLQSDGVVFENKLGEKPSQFSSHCREVDWQEVESKVWDISRCYLFEIIQESIK
jgi:hypothetical protein